MDIRFNLNGVAFIWDARKAQANLARHDGVRFEQAAEVFFDPFFQIVDASRNDEARDAAIGYDAQGRLLFVGAYRVQRRIYSDYFGSESHKTGAR
jgi:uncharacterized DUF497 family protein